MPVWRCPILGKRRIRLCVELPLLELPPLYWLGIQTLRGNRAQQIAYNTGRRGRINFRR